MGFRLRVKVGVKDSLINIKIYEEDYCVGKC